MGLILRMGSICPMGSICLALARVQLNPRFSVMVGSIVLNLLYLTNMVLQCL